MNKIKEIINNSYGNDSLGLYLMLGALIVFIISIIFTSHILCTLSILIVILNLLRMLSRNFRKRKAENSIFLRYINSIYFFVKKLSNKIAKNNQFKKVKCPYCKRKFKINRSHNSIGITCPQCKQAYYK